MTSNTANRQIQSWQSIAFTAGITLYITVTSLSRLPAWLGLFALLPLILLLLTGLYFFALPYLTRPTTPR